MNCIQNSFIANIGSRLGPVFSSLPDLHSSNITQVVRSKICSNFSSGYLKDKIFSKQFAGACTLLCLIVVARFLVNRKASPTNDVTVISVGLKALRFPNLWEIYENNRLQPSKRIFLQSEEYSINDVEKELKRRIPEETIDRTLVYRTLLQKFSWEIVELLIQRMPSSTDDKGANLIGAALAHGLYPKEVVKMLVDRGEKIYPEILEDFLALPETVEIDENDIRFLVEKGAVISQKAKEIATTHRSQFSSLLEILEKE